MRSRKHWLELGDKNTKFFHNSVKCRKTKSRIVMLKDEGNREQVSEGLKSQVAGEYYRNHFQSSDAANLEALFEGFITRATTQMNRDLTSPISEEEIKKTAFGIKSSSAPGVDGLTGVFYQNFWHMIGTSVIKEVKGFFSSHSMPSEWNHTQLC